MHRSHGKAERRLLIAATAYSSGIGWFRTQTFHLVSVVLFDERVNGASLREEGGCLAVLNTLQRRSTL